MNKLPLISIIIVNLNGRKFLEKCLESITKTSYKNYEIILVDNNSSDNSVEFVKNEYSGIRIIKLERNFGYAEPNNIGAKISNGEFLVFLNNDTIVTSDFISEMIKVMNEYPQVAICQSLLLKPNGMIDSSGDFVDINGNAYSLHDKPTEIREILSAKGASMMIRKNVFWELDGFDKNYFVSFEDVDLGWRAWIIGHKVVLVPKSIVHHIGGQTIKKIEKEIQFHIIKNNLLLRLTNFETYHVFTSITSLFLFGFIKRIFGLTINKNYNSSNTLPSFLIISKGILWTIKNMKYILTKRKKINSKRVNSTSNLRKIGIITK